jgi:hypothetical protein
MLSASIHKPSSTEPTAYTYPATSTSVAIKPSGSSRKLVSTMT